MLALRVPKLTLEPLHYKPALFLSGGKLVIQEAFYQLFGAFNVLVLQYYHGYSTPFQSGL